MSWLLESGLILLLLVANGVFAMAEAAVMASRRPRLQRYAEEGVAGAQAAMALTNAPNQFLATTQIGITLIGILAGAFGGATLAAELADVLAGIPGLARYSQAAAVIVVVVVVTYLSLIIGELVPKRLALNNPERVAARIASPMQLLARLATPVVALLSASTEVVLRALGAKPSGEPAVTEEDIKVMLAQGAATGVFEEVEQDMVEGVFRLADRTAEALITPRTEVVWFDVEASLAEVQRIILDSGYARYPVVEGDLDHLLGYVRTTDVLMRALTGVPFDLRSLVQPPVFVPESTPAFRVLETFKQANCQMAFVIDEYGGLQGIVTLHDILEGIAGDAAGLTAADEPQARRREDGSWLVDGRLLIDEFKDLFDFDELPNEDDGDFQTVGGFVLSILGHIPEAGEQFEWNGWRYEIVDMDARRVDKVLMTRLDAPAAE